MGSMAFFSMAGMASLKIRVINEMSNQLNNVSRRFRNMSKSNQSRSPASQYFLTIFFINPVMLSSSGGIQPDVSAIAHASPNGS
jgi:hypothetical protein